MIFHDAKNVGIFSKGQPFAWFIGWFIAIASWKAKNTCFFLIIMEKSGIMAFQDAIARIHGEHHWLSKGRVEYAAGKSTNSTGHSFQEYYLLDVW